MNLIGIIGQKRVGKDTMADYIIKNYNYTKKSLADPLKDACKSIFLLSNEQLYGDKKEIPDSRWNNTTPRQLLQIVGTQLFREDLNKYIPELNNLQNTIWIHNFELWYANNKHNKVVIPDIRFKDEAKMIKDNGGVLIKITRGEFNTSDLHKSEQELEEIVADAYIFNNSTINEYYKTIDTLFNNNLY